MGFIDSIVAAFSPEAAYRREAYRQAYEALKNYDAGSYDRPNQNWRVGNQSAELTDTAGTKSRRGRETLNAIPTL